MSQTPITTASGIPVVDNQNSLTAGPRGPVLLQDFHLIEKLQHFNRERIPERVVHAKGSGAYGTFTVTHDISNYTKAKLFAAIGKQTETFVRFSTVGGERGSAEAHERERDESSLEVHCSNPLLVSLLKVPARNGCSSGLCCRLYQPPFAPRTAATRSLNEPAIYGQRGACEASSAIRILCTSRRASWSRRFPE